MKVILRKSISTLGAIGEIVEVTDGYAVNYLIPRKYAYLALPGNMKAIEEEKKALVVKLAKELEVAKAYASELDALSVNIPVQVGEEDKLFGSVTAQMIADAAKEKGVEIDRRKIDLAEPIKSLGIHSVPVKIHPEVVATIKVWVVAQ